MLLESHAGTCIQGYVYQVLPVHVRRGTSTLVLLDIIGTSTIGLRYWVSLIPTCRDAEIEKSILLCN